MRRLSASGTRCRPSGVGACGAVAVSSSVPYALEQKWRDDRPNCASGFPPTRRPAMLWTVNATRRTRPLQSFLPRLAALTERAAELFRYGALHSGGLEAFSFRCPGPCARLHHVRPRQRRRGFNPRTQRFRCPVCRIELHFSILGEVLPPRMTTRAARAYETRVLRDMVDRPADTVPTIEQAAQLRSQQVPIESGDSSDEI